MWNVCLFTEGRKNWQREILFVRLQILFGASFVAWGKISEAVVKGRPVGGESSLCLTTLLPRATRPTPSAWRPWKSFSANSIARERTLDLEANLDSGLSPPVLLTNSTASTVSILPSVKCCPVCRLTQRSYFWWPGALGSAEPDGPPGAHLYWASGHQNPWHTPGLVNSKSLGREKENASPFCDILCERSPQQVWLGLQI